MKWYKMIEIYLKYDNMHIFGMIIAFNCINNHVISCINSMLSYLENSLILRRFNPISLIYYLIRDSILNLESF